MGILHIPGIRRVVSFWVVAAAAVILATVPAAPATAAESVVTSVIVINPGGRSFADTE
jgi:hypothetical protein